MMPVILAFLRSHWLGASIAASVLGVFTLIGFQHHEVESLRRQVREFAMENIALTHANAALVSSIRNQNAAMESIREKAETLIKASAAERARTAKLAGLYRRNAQAIKATPTSGNECADLRNLVQGYITSVRSAN